MYIICIYTHNNLYLKSRRQMSSKRTRPFVDPSNLTFEELTMYHIAFQNYHRITNLFFGGEYDESSPQNSLQKITTTKHPDVSFHSTTGW